MTNKFFKIKKGGKPNNPETRNVNANIPPL